MTAPGKLIADATAIAIELAQVDRGALERLVEDLEQALEEELARQGKAEVTP